MRRIQSPCCNDNGAILMFGNDYVEASPGSVLASKPRHRARQESSLWLLGRQGKCCIITKETWKSALHWTFPGDRREEHQGEGEGSFLQKLCHWLNSSGLYTFASWWISQNIPVFKRAEMAEAYKRYRDWHWHHLLGLQAGQCNFPRISTLSNHSYPRSTLNLLLGK